MSRPKRNASNWLQSSFDVDGFDENYSKKSKPSPSNDIGQNLSNFVPNGLSKRKISNLSVLLAACAPQKLAELAVSRQKQNEINRWFHDKLKNGKPNILILSGPSGCGKTEALKVIARENGFDVIEWITPMDPAVDDNNRLVRQGEKFEDFIIRATRYNSVLSDNKRLLLVKDLPNSFVDGKDDFSALLKKYCQYGREPLIFICTDAGNSKLMFTLFSQSNRERFEMDLINIAAVTPTSLKNVMKRVTGILNAKASHMLNVTQKNIDEVISNSIGDIRSTLLNLIFASLKVDHKFVSECGSRQETLGLLHGVGRVIHPKKITIEDGKSWKFVHNPDETASCFLTQASTFIRFVHENYLNTIGFNMDGAATAIESISLADIFNSEWRDEKMHSIALSQCIRGVMISNDKPVNQWNPVRKPTTSGFDTPRNYAVAEVEWYEKFISSKIKKEFDLEELSESLVEEITDW